MNSPLRNCSAACPHRADMDVRPRHLQAFRVSSAVPTDPPSPVADAITTRSFVWWPGPAIRTRIDDLAQEWREVHLLRPDAGHADRLRHAGRAVLQIGLIKRCFCGKSRRGLGAHFRSPSHSRDRQQKLEAHGAQNDVVATHVWTPIHTVMQSMQAFLLTARAGAQNNPQGHTWGPQIDILHHSQPCA